MQDDEHGKTDDEVISTNFIMDYSSGCINSLIALLW